MIPKIFNVAQKAKNIRRPHLTAKTELACVQTKPLETCKFGRFSMCVPLRSTRKTRDGFPPSTFNVRSRVPLKDYLFASVSTKDLTLTRGILGTTKKRGWDPSRRIICLDQKGGLGFGSFVGGGNLIFVDAALNQIFGGCLLDGWTLLAWFILEMSEKMLENSVGMIH